MFQMLYFPHTRFEALFSNLSLFRPSQDFDLTLSTKAKDGSAPMTVIESGSVVSEQTVICKRCKKPYKESKNFRDSCR